MQLNVLSKGGNRIRPFLFKSLLFVKLTFLLMIICLQLSAKTYAQNITLSEHNTTLENVFKEIEKQSNYLFVYRNEWLKAAKKVDIDVRNAPIKKVLEQCFQNQPLTYDIIEHTIVIKKNNPEKSATSPPLKIHGQVTDQKGAPLAGVTVKVKGSNNGAITDDNGSFSLEVPDGAILQVSYLGYQSQEIAINGQTSFNIQLKNNASGLNEVVVVGYGTQKKSDLTGSVASVGEKDFTKGVNTNALQLVNGRAAGVYVSQSSSAPGGGVNIRIRGAGSINSSNNVLVVVDGLPGVDPSSLSPEDIASIQVLKDASAAAIYGSRAANGVVLITTKKGNAGKINISYNGYVGVQSVAKKLDVLNAKEYMQVLNGILSDQGEEPTFSQSQIDAAGKGTDWQDVIFRTGLAQNHQLSFSGGGENNKYYVGLNYFNQQGVVLGSNFKKYNARLNYEINPSEKFDFSLALNAGRSDNHPVFSSNAANENAGPINTAIQFDPTLKPILDSNGRYPINPLIALENPLALIYGINQQDIDNYMYGVMTANYHPLKELTLTARLGTNLDNQRNDAYTSRLTQSGLSTGGSGSINVSENTHWLMEYLAKYEREFNGDHHISLLGGITYEETMNRDVGASSQGFLSDVTQTNLLQSGDRDNGDNVSSGKSSNKLNSFLGRLNYTYKEKYLLTATARADGTSRFSDKHKYAFFPSLALGWNISKEPFFSTSSFLNNLKLRLSYGQMGNQAIGDYVTQQTFIAGGIAVLGDGLYQGVEPARIPNPDLRWETTEEYNAGLDFSFLDNRLSGSVEYYIKNTKDQLFSKPIPETTGFGSIFVNFGEVCNAGIDLLLESHNLTGAFEWNSTFTMSWLKNKVVSLPDFIPQIITGNIGTFTNNFSIVQPGSPMFAYYGYEVTGIFKSADEVTHSAQPDAKAGYPIFKDQNGDGKISPDDRVILGTPYPKFTFGLNNAFSYKNFDLNIFVIAVQGIKTLDNNIIESIYPINFERNRIAKYYLDRWTPDNPDAAYPSGVNPSAYGGAYQINSLTVTDASFLRVKTVSLAYDIPLKGKVLDKASLYVSADNIITLTKFEGYDPDANAQGSSVIKANYNSYPLNRTIRLGVRLTF